MLDCGEPLPVTPLLNDNIDLRLRLHKLKYYNSKEELDFEVDLASQTEVAAGIK